MNSRRHSGLCFILAWQVPQFQRRTAGGNDVCLPCGGGGRPGAADSRSPGRDALTSGLPDACVYFYHTLHRQRRKGFLENY